MDCNINTTKPPDGLTAPGSGELSIAVTSDRNQDFDLYLASEDGANVRRLTNEIGFDAEPSWSPDGTQLAFIIRSGSEERSVHP